MGFIPLLVGIGLICGSSPDSFQAPQGPRPELEAILAAPTTQASANRLAELLHDRDDRIRVLAARALGKYMARFNDYMRLLDQLSYLPSNQSDSNHGKWVSRTLMGLRAMALSDDPEAIDAAIRALAHATPTLEGRLNMPGCEVGTDLQLSSGSERLLAGLAGPRRKALTRLLDSNDPQVVFRAAGALLDNGSDQQVVLRLKKLLTHPNPSFRALAVFRLCAAFHQGAYSVIAPALNDPDPLVCAAVDESLKLSEKQAWGLIGRYASLNEVEKRHLLVMAARHSGPYRQALKLALRDPDLSVRESAQMCGEYSEWLSKPEKDEIIAQLTGFPLVRHTTINSRNCSDSRVRGAALACLARSESEVRAVGIQGLGLFKDPSTLPRVMDVTKRQPSAETYGALVEFLYNLGADGLPAVRELLSDPSPVHRNVAVLVLRYRSSDSPLSSGDVDLVARALADPDPDVRIQALYAAKSREMLALVPPIAAMAADPSEPVRLACISVLAHLNAKEAEEALRAIAKYGTKQMRELVLAALKGQDQRRSLTLGRGAKSPD